jgi:5,6,7,8-tetrahydromethanopterin hydro-lyase
MSQNYLFHAGEATVLARDGQFTDAMPEILIGRTDGPVGQAFANLMAQSKGHTAMFAIRACNQLVRPATMLDPRCAKDLNLDKRDMYRTNHEATQLAIRRALSNEPSVDELIANRHRIRHDMDDWS